MAMEVNSRSILSVLNRDFDFKRATIKNRLRVQKIIYLLQASGLKLGYGFEWYKFGPYTQELANDAYAVLSSQSEVFKKQTKTWGFNNQTKTHIEKFKNGLSEIIDDCKQLELVASIDYMCRIWDVSYEDTSEFVKTFMKQKKEYYDKTPIKPEEINTALAFWKSWSSQITE